MEYEPDRADDNRDSNPDRIGRPTTWEEVSATFSPGQVRLLRRFAERGVDGFRHVISPEAPPVRPISSYSNRPRPAR